ncbi:MAG: ABC transporter permease subunit [Fervidobacterium sp.]|jgi:ABC-type transport system involved in multi-copper enzyme maturation permease subunit|uniref:ABC transporter permease subunit n=1 Tax=Fervidobacterium TaxID=2422 RepID=UPI0021F965EC|nr:ABC transporter permease [Fervidobacterium riparium]
MIKGIRKEFNDMKVRFFGTLIVILGLFFILAPFQKFTVSMLEGYMGNPQVEKFLPGSMIERLKEWNFYINTQWYGKNFGQIIPIIGILMAFPLFAREYENGTIAFLLVRRSRKEIYTTKVLMGLMGTVLLVMIGGILPAIFSSIAQKSYEYSVVPKFIIHNIFGALIWYTLSVIFSVLFNDQVKPLLASLGLLALTTTAGLIKSLKFLNTFSYALGMSVFNHNKVDIKYTIGIVILSVLFIFFGYLIFDKKEI